MSRGRMVTEVNPELERLENQLECLREKYDTEAYLNGPDSEKLWRLEQRIEKVEYRIWCERYSDDRRRNWD